MLYRHVVPGLVGRSGAAKAVVSEMKRNIGEMLSREAFNIDSARIDPAIIKPGNGFGFGAPRRMRNLRFNMLPKYCTSMSILVLVFSLCVIPLTAETPRLDDRLVVVVVWDGMRPDFVSEKTTPTLSKLASEGVTFSNQHPVYPSATNVNGTAMVTGVYPGKSGIIANYVYRPDIDSHSAVGIELPSVVEKGDELSGGRYVSAPTVAELVQRAGARSLIASAKTVGLLLDRQLGAHREVGDLSSQDGKQQNAVNLKKSVTLSAGRCLPNVALAPITEVLGPFPSAHLQKDSWTTKALIDVLWKDGVPALSVLWLGEPDLTQHESAPGAPAALAAIKASDENLASVLSALDRQKARETTDLLIVSDHGFSMTKQLRADW